MDTVVTKDCVLISELHERNSTYCTTLNYEVDNFLDLSHCCDKRLCLD